MISQFNKSLRTKPSADSLYMFCIFCSSPLDLQWPGTMGICGPLYLALGIQSPCQMMIGVYNHLLRKVFRLHYHSQKVIGSLGWCRSGKSSLPIGGGEILSIPPITRSRPVPCCCIIYGCFVFSPRLVGKMIPV